MRCSSSISHPVATGSIKQPTAAVRDYLAQQNYANFQLAHTVHLLQLPYVGIAAEAQNHAD